SRGVECRADHGVVLEIGINVTHPLDTKLREASHDIVSGTVEARGRRGASLESIRCDAAHVAHQVRRDNGLRGGLNPEIARRRYAARAPFASPRAYRAFQSSMPESACTLGPAGCRSAAGSAGDQWLIIGAPTSRNISRANSRRFAA